MLFRSVAGPDPVAFVNPEMLAGRHLIHLGRFLLVDHPVLGHRIHEDLALAALDLAELDHAVDFRHRRRILRPSSLEQFRHPRQAAGDVAGFVCLTRDLGDRDTLGHRDRSRQEYGAIFGFLLRLRGPGIGDRPLFDVELAREGDGTDNAACWLKNTVPPRTDAPNSVSGVRGAGVVERRNSAIETSIDRFGGDYHSFALATDPAGESCRAACEGDSKCRAWTYARPGYTGRSARCFLKSTITQPRRRPGLISGVVR